MVKEGDTIVIHDDYEDFFLAGDELVVSEIDSDGIVWVQTEEDEIGFDPDEFHLVKRDNTAGVSVETFQRNLTNANLRNVFG